MGVLTVREKGGDCYICLTANLQRRKKAEFSRITGDQMVTITGVFDEDLAMKLKSYRIIKVE